MGEHFLPGCRTEPLASYLKALGLLRVVGEQLDPGATGRWSGGVFVLGSDFAVEDILAFLVDAYRPTPMVAPWNGRGGFRTDVRRESEKVLAAVEDSEDPRLAPYRATIAAGRRVYTEATERGWDSQRAKERWIQECRAWFPDEAVGWLDATVVLTDAGPTYPPLLGGAGGVLGSMDLSNNFMQRVLDALGLARRPKSRAERATWARAALLDEESPALVAGAVGQFDPAAAGGVNSAPTGAAPSLVNPWEFVLLLEGSLLFTSGAARRLAVDARGTVAVPFTVAGSSVGYASGADDEASRGRELWAPVWSRPATVAELTRLLGEGRSSWRRTQARTGLDFVRAVAALGVDRGIDGFVRHAFLERLGQSRLAVPVGRVAVRARAEVPLLARLEDWLGPLRRARDLPASISAALRRLDEAQFRLAHEGGSSRLLGVLRAAADLEGALARSSRIRDEVVRRPLQGLRALEWLPWLNDGTPELRLAVAIASQRDDLPHPGQPLSETDRRASRLALVLRSVRLGDDRRLAWAERPRIPGLGSRPLSEVLAGALVARIVDATAGSAGAEGVAGGGQVGVQSAFRRRLPARLTDVAALVLGHLDEERLARCLSACLLLDWTGATLPEGLGPLPAERPLLLPAWAVLALFFHGRPLGEGRLLLRPAASWAALLQADRVVDVTTDALRRLRIAGLEAMLANPKVLARAVSGPRLGAALLCPLTDRAVQVLLDAIVPPQPDHQLED